MDGRKYSGQPSKNDKLDLFNVCHPGGGVRYLGLAEVESHPQVWVILDLFVRLLRGSGVRRVVVERGLFLFTCNEFLECEKEMVTLHLTISPCLVYCIPSVSICEFQQL